MKIEDIFLFSTIVFNFVLAFFVLVRSRNYRNILFFIIVALLNSYFYLNNAIDFVSNENEAVILSKFLFGVSIFLPTLLILFILSFKEKYSRSDNAARIILISIDLILLFASLFTDLIVKGADVSVFPVALIRGSLYLIFNIVLFTQFGLILFYAYKTIKKINGVFKLQFRYFVFGSILTMVLIILTNVVLPMFNISQFVRMPSVFSIIFTIAVTASILRYRLFSIRTVTLNILRTLVLAALFFSIVFLLRLGKEYLLRVTQFSFEALTLDAIFSFIVAAITMPFLGFVSKKLEQIIKPEIYYLKDLTKRIERDASKDLDSEAVKSRVINIFQEVFPYSKISFENRTKVYDILKIPFAKELSNDLLFSTSYIYSKSADSSEYEFAIEISETDAIIFTHKNNSEPYTATELSILTDCMFILRDMFQKVEIYSRVKAFNKTLEDEIKKATNSIQQKNSELQEQLRKERDMMDILGHELRTPLSIGRNAISMIEMELKTDSGKTIEKEKIQALLDKAIDNLRREVKILETVLSSTRLENNKVQVNFQNINLREVINTTIEAFKAEAQKKSIKLLIAMPDNDMFVYSGREQLQEILDNLVSNAVKYTKQGSITVEVEERDKDICINVIDTGEGIPAEEIPKLGKKFYRVNPYLESSIDNVEKVVRPGGTGIGLYVVFGLAGLLNGRIDIKSEVGKGSTFTLVVPKAKMIKPTLKLGSN